MAVLLLAAGSPVVAQEAAPAVSPVNSFFERGPVKEYALKSVYVGGEVENPGPVELAALPLRAAAVKEVAFENGKPEFKGAYFFTGYSLYDIINAKPVKKAGADFSPEVDLYVVVENDKGEKAVFSWGELYYSRFNFNALITSSARAVNPGKKKTEWPLPEAPRLVCSGDLYNTRFIANPSKITVKAAPGVFPGKKHVAVFTPEFSVIVGGKALPVPAPGQLAEKRVYQDTAYGHGTGFKGVKTTEGFVLKDVLAKAGALPQDSGASLVVVSAKDSYRAAFSLAEIVNRNDNADFLVVDKGQDKDGRFALFSTADFFIDRNVRSVNKVEVLKP
ncbi:MAG: hypothetical protein A2X35_09000 [Elusimicrobia bacterium GWA2_61_42]|nr:MAG: hypothetical protein A2X35_09000 [Elusimicrobia bacterium GWA2_61_42]OGR75720.1 MAG: hypothetical protein A2X38_06945 [Elusimicrobia bacterium GWC2_61_25]